MGCGNIYILPFATFKYIHSEYGGWSYRRSCQRGGGAEECYNVIIHGHGVSVCEGVAVADSNFVCFSTAS